MKHCSNETREGLIPFKLFLNYFGHLPQARFHSPKNRAKGCLIRPLAAFPANQQVNVPRPAAAQGPASRKA